MKVSRRQFTGGAVAGLVATFVPACGPGTPNGKVADVKAGPMPKDGDWSAEYYSELVGTIIILTKGTVASGKWQRPHKDKWAEFHGEIDGNLMHFTWTEYLVGGIGPNTVTKGKGYFVYTRPEGDSPTDHIIGQIGHKEDEVGDEVNGIKQLNVTPNLDKIGGTSARDVNGADWDKNDEAGKAEPPASPP